MRGAAARRAALAVAGGVLLYAGHPPFDQPWAGLVALIPLLALAVDLRGEAHAGRLGLAYGTLAGLVFFGPLIEWIARFGLIAWVLLALMEALFVGAFVAGLARWGTRRGFGVAAVALWAGLEALRGLVPLGGFPWGLLGYTQAHGPLLGAARSVGVLGVGALCAAVSVALYRLMVAVRGGARLPVRPALALGVIASLAGLCALPSARALGASVDIAAVQGNDIVESSRVESRRVREVAAHVADATIDWARAATSMPDVVVWPENSLDGDVTASTDLARTVRPALAALGGTPVLAGMLTDGPVDGTFRNTVTVLRAGPVAGARYVKRQIVPFGEYVPGRRWLDWIPALDQIPNDAVAGDEATLFRVGAARIGVPICFENIFPSVTHDFVRAGANVLVVSTNNASYGFSAASRQHLAFSRLRAVETDRWILHAGISGISAFVSPSGAVSQVTAPFERAVIRAELPLRSGITPAVRFGRALEWVALLAGAFVLAVALRRRRGSGGG